LRWGRLPWEHAVAHQERQQVEGRGRDRCACDRIHFRSCEVPDDMPDTRAPTTRRGAGRVGHRRGSPIPWGRGCRSGGVQDRRRLRVAPGGVRHPGVRRLDTQGRPLVLREAPRQEREPSPRRLVLRHLVPALREVVPCATPGPEGVPSRPGRDGVRILRRGGAGRGELRREEPSARDRARRSIPEDWGAVRGGQVAASGLRRGPEGRAARHLRDRGADFEPRLALAVRAALDGRSTSP